MSAWFWVLAILSRAISGTDIHLILENDLRPVFDLIILNRFGLKIFARICPESDLPKTFSSDQEVQWSIDYIEQSFTNSLTFSVHVRKLRRQRVNLSNRKLFLGSNAFSVTRSPIL